MADYDFREKKEYKKYKQIGKKKSALKKYSDWKKEISNKYKDKKDRDKINFIKYLTLRMRIYKYKKNLISAVLFPGMVFLLSFVATLPSILIGGNQYYDTIQADRDNRTLEQIINKTEDAYNKQMELETVCLSQLQDRYNLHKLTRDFSVNTVSVVYSVAVIYIGVLGIWLRSIYKKIDFYSDYIEIIEELKIEKSS